MTIVDSINGVTSALGGDPKEANTIQEAIDAFKPVIVEKTSGGGGGGSDSGSGAGLPTMSVIINETWEYGNDPDTGDATESHTTSVESIDLSNLMDYDSWAALQGPGEYDATNYIEDVYIDGQIAGTTITEGSEDDPQHHGSIFKTVGKHSLFPGQDGDFDEIIVFTVSQTGARSPYGGYPVTLTTYMIHRTRYPDVYWNETVAGTWTDWTINTEFSYSS